MLLKWTNVPACKALGYPGCKIKVHYGVPGSGFSSVVELPNLRESFTVSGLDPIKKYSFDVEQYDSARSVRLNDTIILSGIQPVAEGITPPPPQPVMTVTPGVRSVTLSWPVSERCRTVGNVRQQLWYRLAGMDEQGRPLAVVDQVEWDGPAASFSTTYTFRNVEPGVLYTFNYHCIELLSDEDRLRRLPVVYGDVPSVTTQARWPAPAASAGSSSPVDPTQRSWPLTEIANEGATEWWFPIGRGKCDMKDEIRPWTWKNWTAPTADQCGWLSIPDVRADLEEPVDELAFKVYTALISSPDIDGRARVGRPSGPSVKLAVWAVYPRPYDGRMVNSTRRLKGPYESAITVCLPGSEGQAIHGYDAQEGKWVVLESVEAEREGHICGLHQHDLGLLVVSGN